MEVLLFMVDISRCYKATTELMGLVERLHGSSLVVTTLILKKGAYYCPSLHILRYHAERP